MVEEPDFVCPSEDSATIVEEPAPGFATPMEGTAFASWTCSGAAGADGVAAPAEGTAFACWTCSGAAGMDGFALPEGKTAPACGITGTAGTGGFATAV